jgi:dihydrodipicolinate reductase
VAKQGKARLKRPVEAAAEDKTSLKSQEAAGRRFAETIGSHAVRVYTVPGHTRDILFWSDAEAEMPTHRWLRQNRQAHAFDILLTEDA